MHCIAWHRIAAHSLPPTRSGAAACCSGFRRPAAGFTLIEMVAVMTLVALMAGVAMPAMQRWFDSISTRAQLSEVSVQFQRLASRAALLSQTVVLSKDTWDEKMSDGEAVLALPEGWSIAGPGTTAVTFFHSGVCDGGTVELLGPQQRRIQLQIARVSCDVSIVK